MAAPQQVAGPSRLHTQLAIILAADPVFQSLRRGIRSDDKMHAGSGVWAGDSGNTKRSWKEPVGTEVFRVENIKCATCVRAIRDALTALPNVEAVEVDMVNKRVTVLGRSIERDTVAAKLAHIGYPEVP